MSSRWSGTGAGATSFPAISGLPTSISVSVPGTTACRCPWWTGTNARRKPSTSSSAILHAGRWGHGQARGLSAENGIKPAKSGFSSGGIAGMPITGMDGAFADTEEVAEAKDTLRKIKEPGGMDGKAEAQCGRRMLLHRGLREQGPKESHAQGSGRAPVGSLRAWALSSPGCWRASSRRKRPTRVGKTGGLFGRHPIAQKHPHTRGEDGRSPRASSRLMETPPHAWGRLL